MKNQNDMDSGIMSKRQGGFTLLEVIMAISILTIGILAVASMQLASLKGNAFSQDVTESTDRIQDVVEKLYALNNTAAQLTAGTHTEDELGANSNTDKYTVTWTVQDNTPITSVKTVTTIVAWTDRGAAKTHSFSFMRTEI